MFTPLGRADHNLVHLQPFYKPIIPRQPAVTKIVIRWTRKTEETLQGCFEATDWDVLCNAHGDNFDNLTGCVTDYSNFCAENVVPKKKKTFIASPTINLVTQGNIKATLNKKKRFFRNCDKEQLKCVQKELKAKTAEGNKSLRRKLESKLQENNTREVWKGMWAITGLRQKRCVDGWGC